MLSGAGQSRSVPWCIENSTAAVSCCLEQGRADVQCCLEQGRAGVYHAICSRAKQMYNAVWSREEHGCTMLYGEEQIRCIMLSGAGQSRGIPCSLEDSRAGVYRAVWKRINCGRNIPGISLVHHIAINPFYVRNALNFIDSNLKSVTWQCLQHIVSFNSNTHFDSLTA